MLTLWFDFKDKKPPRCEEFIVTDGMAVGVGLYIPELNEWRCVHEPWIKLNADVTHWMKLPEPYNNLNVETI